MRSTGRRRRATRFFSISGWRAPLLAAASGVLLSYSFPTSRAWWLIFVALVPLFVVLHEGTPGPASRGPAPRGVRWAPWIAGIVFNLLTFWWIVRVPATAMTHPSLIYVGLIALSLYLGLFVALFGWMARFGRRRLGFPVLVLAPAAWCACEWLKSYGALGCPWGNVSYALARHPAWIQGASLAGAPGLSLWIVVVNALLAGAIVARTWPQRTATLLVAALAIALPVRWGEGRLHAPVRPEIARVALVQPNIASEEKWNVIMQDSVVTRLFQMTREAAALEPQPALIIWPETALPYYVRLEPGKLQRVYDLVKEIGIPVLAGYPDAHLGAGGDVITNNAAGIIRPNGKIGAQYEKIHLVPFGERIPFQGVFPFLHKIELGQAEWTPGTRYVIFSGAGPAFGVLICFESIFPDHARRYALEGAQYLVNITNDEWFGPTAGPVQHAEMAILRSAELGLSTARCANTGISMFVDPYGRVRNETGLFRPAVLEGSIQAGVETLYVRWGDWLTPLCLGLVGIVLAVGWFRPHQRLETRSRTS
jgi:apolipoprotein N-acyltransferase